MRLEHVELGLIPPTAHQEMFQPEVKKKAENGNIFKQNQQESYSKYNKLSYDKRHEKRDLKVFVGVIPKEGLGGPRPGNPSLGMTTTKTLRSLFS